MHTRGYEVARLLADRRKAQVPDQERLQEKLTQPALFSPTIRVPLRATQTDPKCAAAK